MLFEWIDCYVTYGETVLERHCVWVFFQQLAVSSSAMINALQPGKNSAHLSVHLETVVSWVSSFYFSPLAAHWFMNTMQTRFSVLQPPHSSSDTSIFCLPSVRTHSLGQISFPCAAPSVWSTHTHTHSTLAFWAIQAGLLTPLPIYICGYNVLFLYFKVYFLQLRLPYLVGFDFSLLNLIY